jgi:hypothetical protein
MREVNIIDYLERQIEGLIYEHSKMPKFMTYKDLQNVIKDEFKLAKIYHKYQMVEMLKYVMHYENKDGSIRTTEDYDAFAEAIFDKFYNQ